MLCLYRYPSTEAILLVNYKMVRWCGQATSSSKNLPLHADGKHKLHYVGWILLSVGGHTFTDSTSSHTFTPMLMSIAREHESEEHARLLGDGLDRICSQFWHCPSPFALLISDHSAGLRAGLMRREMKFGLCYSHITCAPYLDVETSINRNN